VNLVNKYAHAYLHVSSDQLTTHDVLLYQQVAAFLHTHVRALFLLKVPVIPCQVKREALKEVTTRFRLHVSIQSLIDLLLAHKRAFLLADILDEISRLYHHKKSIHTFTVTSSAELTDDERKNIERFLADKVQGTIMYTYVVDKKLIAGIRLQSETLLWEHSIDKQLRDVLFSRNQ
jgi:ATP synthase F1 delta subunit